jgi:putative transposase
MSDDPIRAYELKQHANFNKKKVIVETLFLYRKLAHKISGFNWMLFYKDGKQFKDFQDIKHIETFLSERYKQTCQTQVIGTLKSYISNVKIRFVNVVNCSTIEGEQRMHLFYINKYNLWFRKKVLVRGVEINAETMSLARKIFKHLTKNKPSFKHYNMVLDEKIATLEKKCDGDALKFDYWIHLSTKNKGKKICIPLQTNKYFDSIGGVFKKVVQVNYKNEKLTFSAIKQLKPELIEHASEKLGLDIGNVVFLATEHGELIGMELMKKLKKYDGIITALFKNLKKQGKKPNSSKKYRDLNNKVRELLKNEIGRIINRLVNRHLPKEIVIENLDFKSSNIGRKNNRILSRFGKGILTKKLDSISESKGIKITKINPAYTSQECPNCHYTHANNRVSRDKFVCGHCGLTGHADVIGARNSSSRSSVEFSKLHKKKEIFQYLAKLHENWKALRQKCECCDSSATDLSLCDC